MPSVLFLPLHILAALPKGLVFYVLQGLVPHIQRHRVSIQFHIFPKFPPAKSWLQNFDFLKTAPKAGSLRRRRIDAQLCFQFPPENQHIRIRCTFSNLRPSFPTCLPTLPEGSRGCFSFKNFKASSALRLWTNFMRSSSEVGFGAMFRNETKWTSCGFVAGPRFSAINRGLIYNNIIPNGCKKVSIASAGFGYVCYSFRVVLNQFLSRTEQGEGTRTGPSSFKHFVMS